MCAEPAPAAFRRRRPRCQSDRAHPLHQGVIEWEQEGKRKVQLMGLQDRPRRETVMPNRFHGYLRTDHTDAVCQCDKEKAVA